MNMQTRCSTSYPQRPASRSIQHFQDHDFNQHSHETWENGVQADAVRDPFIFVIADLGHQHAVTLWHYPHRPASESAQHFRDHALTNIGTRQFNKRSYDGVYLHTGTVLLYSVALPVSLHLLLFSLSDLTWFNYCDSSVMHHFISTSLWEMRRRWEERSEKHQCYIEKHQCYAEKYQCYIEKQQSYININLK